MNRIEKILQGKINSKYLLIEYEDKEIKNKKDQSLMVGL